MFINKKKFLFLFPFVLSTLIILSCEKEKSCEGCSQTNKPPIAKAGNDQTITLPVNNVALNGSASTDPENSILNYAWSKISRPPSFNISNSNAVQTQVTSLVEGIYQFKLTVTDNGGLSAADTVKITVNPVRLHGEIIFDSLTWNFGHDGNDPMGINDEIALEIYDATNILSYTPISVFVKLDSVGTWVAVNPIAIFGICTPPYSYYIVTNALALGQLILRIDDCLINMNLVGTGASVKIVY